MAFFALLEDEKLKVTRQIKLKSKWFEEREKRGLKKRWSKGKAVDGFFGGRARHQ